MGSPYRAAAASSGSAPCRAWSRCTPLLPGPVADGRAGDTTMVVRRVAALEERLGVQLMRRSTRAVQLTESGQISYDRCVAVLVAAHLVVGVGGPQLPACADEEAPAQLGALLRRREAALLQARAHRGHHLEHEVPVQAPTIGRRREHEVVAQQVAHPE